MTEHNIIRFSETVQLETGEDVGLVAKPNGFSLDSFRSKRAPTIAGVATLQTGLPVMRLSEAKDFVRLHPDEDRYWSPELCFVNVPIKGQKKDHLHLINEDIAMAHLPSGRIARWRLALATKPFDVFFLCGVPSQNLENTWNETSLRACILAKTLWTQTTSRKEEGVEAYKIDHARNPEAFPEPTWPAQSLEELIRATFEGRAIDREDHPGLLRLVGDTPGLS